MKEEWGPSLKVEFQRSARRRSGHKPMVEKTRNNPTGTRGQGAGERLRCNKIKIGRNHNTKGLIFAKYIGAQNSSNE